MPFNRYPSLVGSVVYVTGGASGIGADMVRAFAEQDATVGFVDIDADKGSAFARDLGKHRIRVNTIVPGWIMTERQKELWATPEALERHRARQCLPDLIEPVYVARMALFLASDDAAMCTGNNYMVEAGSI